MPLVMPGQESPVSEPGTRFARHHHFGAYAALVIRGCCHEAGDRGRFLANAGDLLIHRSFDAHADVIGNRGAAFLHFPADAAFAGPLGSVDDVDGIVHAYERDPCEAAALVHDQLRIARRCEQDWPDLLARHLARDLVDEHQCSLAEWAELHGLHPTTISRGFRLAYGVMPKRYRLEQRASRAARRIRDSTESLSSIASDIGFADQAHMTRTVAQLFGRTPGALRRLS